MILGILSLGQVTKTLGRKANKTFDMSDENEESEGSDSESQDHARAQDYDKFEIRKDSVLEKFIS